jgi:hypothetical protein
MLRMLVTGGPPTFGGVGMPQRIRHLPFGARIADDWRRIVQEDAWHRLQVADVAVDDAEERRDGGLVGGDALSNICKHTQ